MKKLLLTLFIYSSLFSLAQNPLVKIWDYRYGSMGLDVPYSFQQTSDGGYIFGGFSDSGIGADKTEVSQGGSEYWIVKLDSLGHLQWDKDFGGTSYDEFTCMQQTADGGYILGGYSASGVGGDKTQPLQGTYDYWIVKTDGLGNKQWDKTFGGTDYDRLNSLQQTSDGGYILGGWSNSGISGDKTQNTWNGSADYWIVKTDSLGIKQWDKDVGGAGDDALYSLQQATDGGYILGGYSFSDSSGDKTENNWGNVDYWIVKTDSLGIKQWDRDYGGTGDDLFCEVKQTRDGGFILGGKSYSGISGNKSTPNWNGASRDFWIVKTDSLGYKEWEKDFGGTDEEDEFGDIYLTTDGGYLIGGTSYSNISGDKTENNLGSEQSWIIKTDSLGNKLWDKTIFTLGHVEQGFTLQSKDGCYLVANPEPGGIGGYKSQAAHWNLMADYWIVKFCDTTQAPIVAFITSSPICPGSCTDFTNLSFNAMSYQWNFLGASPDTSTVMNPQSICYANPGSYDVQLIATNANGSDTLLLPNYIIVYPSPPPQGITQNGDTLFANAGATSYQWYFNSNTVNGATNYFYIATAGGDYNVVATDTNGCEVEAAIFDVVTTVNTLSFANEVLLYPNPTSSKLSIISSSKISQLKIFDLIGKEFLSQAISGYKKEIDIHSLSNGIYFLQLQTEQGSTVKKFIKE